VLRQLRAELDPGQEVVAQELEVGGGPAIAVAVDPHRVHAEGVDLVGQRRRPRLEPRVGVVGAPVDELDAVEVLDDE
jgi:hypothetical protein